MKAVKKNEIMNVESNVDLGNLFVKGAGYDSEGNLVLKHFANLVETRDTLDPRAKMIEFRNRKLFLGVGSKNNNVQKHTRDFLLEQVLAMTCDLYSEYSDLVVDLKIGLPPGQYVNKENQQALLNKFELNTEYVIYIDNVLKSVTIRSIKICIEGYSAFVCLADSIEYQGKDILIVDVGGGTTDACPFSFDFESDIFIPGRPITEPKGSIDMVTDITNRINATHGADIKDEQVDVYLRKGNDSILYGNHTYSLNDYLPYAMDTSNIIYNKLVNEYGTLEKYIVVLVGGGYKLFGELAGSKICHKLELSSNDRFYANVIGFSLQ